MKRSDRIHFPLAVYEATFADGSKARLSFGRRRKDGSPDADKGRGFVELLWCREQLTPLPWSSSMWDAHARDHVPFTVVPALWADERRPPIIDGWIEFKGERTRDPHFEAGKPVTERIQRVTHKQALRELVAALSDPTVTPEALRPVFEQARKLAA